MYFLLLIWLMQAVMFVILVGTILKTVYGWIKGDKSE